MDVHRSFQLAGRLKASQEIIAKDHIVKSWKLWVWILGQQLTGALVFWPGLFHASLSIVMLFFLAAPAFHRSGTFTSCSFDARDLSLHMMFPRGYSAFGLAQEQRPARWFMIISVLLRLGGLLSIYPMVMAMHICGYTPEIMAQAERNAGQQQTDSDMNGAVSYAVAMAFGVMFCVSGCGICGCCVLSRCFCTGNDFSGAAEADPDLQQRVEDRARDLSEQMRKSELKPASSQYVMLHVDMLLFVWDFVSDGLAAWKFFELELYGFFAFQVAIIFMALWEETRVVRRVGNLQTVYCAVAESSRILFGFASVYLPQSGGLQLLGHDVSYLLYLFSLFKTFTSMYSSTKAAYVLMHLDLGRHIAVAVEHLGLRSAPGTVEEAGITAQVGPSHRQEPPAQLVGPAAIANSGLPPGVAPPPTHAPAFPAPVTLQHAAPAQPSASQRAAARFSIRPALSSSLRLSTAPLPPIQVGAPRRPVDKE
ncbi:unnamed protein product [Symbiodinium sp. CCMP2592]|nr:unnamed protein product [Symbiodinium sp. CCMP2592]